MFLTPRSGGAHLFVDVVAQGRRGAAVFNGRPRVGSFSIWHWLIVLAAFATVIPVAKALSRVGLSPWWAVLSFVPIVGWIGIWAFAYAPWPKIDPAKRDEQSS